MRQTDEVLIEQKISLTEQESSQLYGMSVAWFQRKRWDGTGPRYCKIGRAVRYPREELERFFSSRLQSSTSDAIAHSDHKPLSICDSKGGSNE